VWAVDLERLDERAFAFTTMHGAARYLCFDQGRCVALRLTADGRAACSIYAMRPDACRWLERGSGACRAQLEAKWSLRRELLAQLANRER
jgi:Fe-S-cluster containining protein